MSEHTTWDDAAREDLRGALRDQIIGEVRLANSDHDDILQTCREVYIAQDVCDCAHEQGFEPNWDGDFSRKIGVSLNWQR